MKTTLQLVDRGLVPKPLLRFGIRRLLSERLEEQRALYGSDHDAALDRWMRAMRSGPVAPVPEKANEQHYEVPPAFFEYALGKRLKYSSAFYPNASTTLNEAEEAMLALTAERAQLADGQDVLELGCGWGSLTLWMAERFPGSRILAVSNSAPQREFIQARAFERGLSNVEVRTADMNDFQPTGSFDRVVSVEMFEHMRNWEELLGRVAPCLRPDGRVFLHVFAHRRYAYPFEVRGPADWMSEHFFSGGMMPCPGMFERLETPLEVDRSWVVPGTHYARTAEDWLRNIEAERDAVTGVLDLAYDGDGARWFQRWRVFFLSCAELFGYRDGNEWFVSHLRLRPGSPA